jgi:signal transduction histidine kinase
LLDSVLAFNDTTLERKKIKVWREYKTAAKIYGFRSEIRQVFANLIVNAIDAIAKDGELYVRVSRDPSSRDVKDRLRVTILDNGAGISESAKRNLFRPFFTTKSEGGNGLGLWVSQGIIAKHGGKIRFRSRTTNGKSGTAFTVFLPVGGTRVRGLTPPEK